MAVRTVRRGSQGLLYGLIFFVFLTLVCLAMAVMFYSDLDKQRKLATEAGDDIGKYVSPAERNSPEIKTLLAEAKAKNRTVYGSMKTELEAMRRIIASKPDITMTQLEKALADAGLPSGERVVPYLETLKRDLTNAQKQLKDLDEKRKESEAQLAAMGQKYQSLQKDRDDQLTALGERIQKLQAEYNAFQQQKTAELAEISKKSDTAQSKFANDLRQRDGDIKNLQNQVAKRDTRIKLLEANLKPQRPTVPDLTREADGRIISVDPQHGMVWVDIGRKDHLVLGTTFEVFDGQRGVEVSEDGKELKRGKASLEVVSLNDKSAGCRIVRSNYSQPVLVNDLIANLVYDRERSFKFYIFGDFDLDGDGVATLSDRETVLTLIREWGGQIAKPEERNKALVGLLGKDEADKSVLPLDTDFVVIGKEPELPKAVNPGETRPEVIRETIQAKQRWDAYIRIKNEAAALSIPVINQNRFLALIGYYKQR